jgi:hypothetical protein
LQPSETPLYEGGRNWIGYKHENNKQQTTTMQQLRFKAILLVVLAVIIQCTIAFKGVFTNREFGANSRLSMCEVTCDVTGANKVCYEGAYTRGKTSLESADQSLVGIILGSATNDKFTGIWVEAGGLWGHLELQQLSNKSIDGFWAFDDGNAGQGVKYRWYDDFLSDNATAESCYAFVGTRPTQSIQGTLTGRNTASGINHIVCAGASTNDATAGSVWQGVGANVAFHGTAQGRLFGYNGAMVWAGSFVDTLDNSPHSFDDENGGATIYKAIAPDAVYGSVWTEASGLYTSTNLNSFTFYAADTYDYVPETKTYEDCYAKNSQDYFWTGTFEDPNGGYQYLCPQADGLSVGVYSFGYTNMASSVNSDVVVGKNPRMIGYIRGTPSNDDTKFTGTWFEPDASLNLTTGVFEWTKLNSTHRQSKWWYGADKTKDPEANIITQRVSIAASDYVCRVIPENKSINGAYGSLGDICIAADKSVTTNFDGFQGVSYLNNALIIGTYTQNNKQGVAIITKYRLYEDSVDGIMWNTRDSTYSDATFNTRIHAAQTSATSNCVTPVDSQEASTSTRSTISLLVVCVLLLITLL